MEVVGHAVAVGVDRCGIVHLECVQRVVSAVVVVVIVAQVAGCVAVVVRLVSVHCGSTVVELRAVRVVVVHAVVVVVHVGVVADCVAVCVCRF